MIAIDATTLLLILSKTAPPPADPVTKVPIAYARERIEFLIKTASEKKIKIVIPTPVLSEVLVYAGSATADYISIINKTPAFRVASFDSRAALEVALMCRIALGENDKKGGSTAPWAKIKYDRQIVAIAKVEGVTEIYSDDADIKAIAGNVGISVVKLSDCPLPPELTQQSLPYSCGPDT